MAEKVTLDVRTLPPWERHPAIFGVLDGLKAGDTLELVNDHDPKPLHYQIMAERPDEFGWKVAQISEREFVASIQKLK